MPEGAITNPKAALRTVSDFTTWEDADGKELELGYTQIAYFRADSAITRLDAVSFVVATPAAATPLSVEKFPTTNTLLVSMSFCGVAQEGAAAGDVIPVAVGGYTRVNVGTADPVRGSLLTRAGSAAGAVGVTLAASHDATVIAGTVFGFFLDVEDADNFAPCWLGRF